MSMQELFELDLVEHPFFGGENNIKSEEEKQLNISLKGREYLQTFG